MCFEQVKAKNEIFMSDYILFLKSKIRVIFEPEYMCRIFTFVQYICVWKRRKPCVCVVCVCVGGGGRENDGYSSNCLYDCRVYSSIFLQPKSATKNRNERVHVRNTRTEKVLNLEYPDESPLP